MKIASIILNVVLVGVLLYTIYFNPARVQPSLPPPNCNTLCADYSLDGGFRGIDAKLAKMLADNYAADEGKKFIGAGRTITTTEDARNAWFPLETLKRFIWQIEHAACKQGCAGDMRLGIRIYYAKYPDSATMRQTNGLTDVKPAYALHHTVFMVPTYEASGGNLDFDPFHWGTDNCQPKTIAQHMATGWVTESPLAHILLAASTREGDSQNHGDMSPPPSGAGTFGTE